MWRHIVDFPPDHWIDRTLIGVFSKPSLVVHTAWFVYWFIARLDISLLTNIVSLEAIYIGILIGIQQLRHHKTVLHLTRHKPDGTVEHEKVVQREVTTKA